MASARAVSVEWRNKGLVGEGPREEKEGDTRTLACLEARDGRSGFPGVPPRQLCLVG